MYWNGGKPGPVFITDYTLTTVRRREGEGSNKVQRNMVHHSPSDRRKSVIVVKGKDHNLMVVGIFLYIAL